MNPGKEILKEMAERDIPVVIGSDSHDAHRVAADFDKALNQLLEAGYHNVSYFLDRQRYDLPINEVSLAEPQPIVV